MSGAEFYFDQPTGVGAAAPGNAQRNLWQTKQVFLTCTSAGLGSYVWELLDAPPGSAASINNASAQIADFTPDLPGSYRIRLTVNGGGAGNVSTKIGAVRKSAAGAAINRSWRTPAFKEQADETNWDDVVNDRGYAPDWETIVADILLNAFGGGGGGSGGENGADQRANLRGKQDFNTNFYNGTWWQVTSDIAPITDVSAIGRYPAYVAPALMGSTIGRYDMVTRATDNLLSTGSTVVRLAPVESNFGYYSGLDEIGAYITQPGSTLYFGLPLPTPGTGGGGITWLFANGFACVPNDDLVVSFGTFLPGLTTCYTFTGGSFPFDILFDDLGRAWVSCTLSNEVKVFTVDPNTLAFAIVTSISVTSPTNMCFDGQNVWVINSGTTTISRINATTLVKDDVNLGIVYSDFFAQCKYWNGYVYTGTFEHFFQINPTSLVVTDLLAGTGVGSTYAFTAFDFDLKGNLHYTTWDGLNSSMRVLYSASNRDTPVIAQGFVFEDSIGGMVFPAFLTTDSVGEMQRITVTGPDKVPHWNGTSWDMVTPGGGSLAGDVRIVPPELTNNTVTAVRGITTGSELVAGIGEVPELSDSMLDLRSPREVVSDGTYIYVAQSSQSPPMWQGGSPLVWKLRLEGDKVLSAQYCNVANDILLPLGSAMQVRDIAADSSYLYAVCWGASAGSGVDNICVIDKVTMKVVGWGFCPDQPISVAADDAGNFYVATNNQSIEKFTTASCIGQSAGSVLASSSCATAGNVRWVRYGGGKLWVAYPGGSPTLYKIDATTMVLDLSVADVAGDTNIFFAMYDPLAGVVWASSSSGNVYRVDPTTLTSVVSWNMGSSGRNIEIGLAPDGVNYWLYVTTHSRQLFAVDPLSNTLQGPWVCSSDINARYEGLAAIDGHMYLASWLTGAGGSSFGISCFDTKLSTATQVVANKLLTYKQPSDKRLNGWFCDQPGIGSIAGVSLGSVATVVTGAGLGAVVADDTMVYIARTGMQDLLSIDGINTKILRLPDGFYASEMTLTLTDVWLLMYDANGYSHFGRIDRSSGKLISSIPIPAVNPRGIAYDSNNDSVWCADFGGNYMWRLEVATSVVTALDAGYPTTALLFVNGSIWACTQAPSMIQVNPSGLGAIVTTFSLLPAGASPGDFFESMLAMAIPGPDIRIFFTDSTAPCAGYVDVIATTVWGAASGSAPTQMAYDGTNLAILKPGLVSVVDFISNPKVGPPWSSTSQTTSALPLYIAGLGAGFGGGFIISELGDVFEVGSPLGMSGGQFAGGMVEWVTPGGPAVSGTIYTGTYVSTAQFGGPAVTDTFYGLDTSVGYAGGYFADLPTISVTQGQVFVIKDVYGHAADAVVGQHYIHVNPTGGGTVDGFTSPGVAITTAFGSITVMCLDPLTDTWVTL